MGIAIAFSFIFEIKKEDSFIHVFFTLPGKEIISIKLNKIISYRFISNWMSFYGQHVYGVAK